MPVPSRAQQRAPRSAGAIVLLTALATLVSCAQVPAASHALAEMPLVVIRIEGEQHIVRLAATAATRAHGFQDVPEDELHREAIYFHFDAPLVPSFHMRNVAAPLWVAWITPDGKVAEMVLMEPGRSLYSPRDPIAGALEFSPRHPLALHVRPGVHVAVDAAGSTLPP
jgi:uncharacterized protein